MYQSPHTPLPDYPSWLTEVPMHVSKEKSTHRLSVPLPKIKHGDVDDMEAEDTAEE